MQVPAAARPDRFEVEAEPSVSPYAFRKVKGDANKEGERAATIPGQVAGIYLAQERFGTLSRRQVMAPAVRLACEGFPMRWFLALEIYNHLGLLRRSPAISASLLKPDGGSCAPPPLDGGPELLRQPDLADTLEAVAEGSADAFYRGPTAERIAAHVQAHGPGFCRLPGPPDGPAALALCAELRRRGQPAQALQEDMGATSFARPNSVLIDEGAGVIRAGSCAYFHAAGFEHRLVVAA